MRSVLVSQVWWWRVVCVLRDDDREFPATPLFHLLPGFRRGLANKRITRPWTYARERGQFASGTDGVANAALRS